MGSGPATPAPPPGPGRGLFDKYELAAYLNVPVGWVEKANAARELPITWVGKHARYDLRDIDAWLLGKKEMPAGFVAPVVTLVPPSPAKPKGKVA